MDHPADLGRAGDRNGGGNRGSSDRRTGTPDIEVVAPTVAAAPVLVHVPHAGTRIPGPARDGLLVDDEDLATELRLLTDHRTDVLAAATSDVGATRLVNRLSRLVVDPERFPDEREELAARGMGAVYTRGHAQQPLRAPTPAQVDELLGRYYHPYAARVTELVDELLTEHGRVTIVDLHSYPSERLPYELHTGPRPQLCIGTDPHHTPAWLSGLVAEVAGVHDLDVALDTPFAGAYVPLRHHSTDHRVTSVMLELRRDLYLDETTAHPHPGESGISGVVTATVAAIAAWHWEHPPGPG